MAQRRAARDKRKQRLLARIPARMKVLLDKGTIPGAVTLVERHGRWCGAFGTYGWVDPKKDLVGLFLVQPPRAISE